MSIFNKEKWDALSSSMKADELREYLISADSDMEAPEPDPDLEDGEPATHRVVIDLDVNYRVEEIGDMEDPHDHSQDAKRYAEANQMADGGFIDPPAVEKTEWQMAKRPFNWMGGLTLTFASLAVIAFNFSVLTLFPFFVSAATVFFGLTLLVVIDALIIPGDTYKTIARSSTGLAVVFLALSILVGIGLLVGQSYVTNPFSTEERVEVPAPEEAGQETESGPDPAADSISPDPDAELALPSSEGSAFREQ